MPGAASVDKVERNPSAEVPDCSYTSGTDGGRCAPHGSSSTPCNTDSVMPFTILSWRQFKPQLCQTTQREGIGLSRHVARINATTKSGIHFYQDSVLLASRVEN